ncbi:response regulator [uncultured Desulfuromusa sp.]|uniref:response regulator n=1 Tax=uncultured Desulfuromusa sp. TaxID=219183 RepID=UPI002AA6EC42|nr:response regulator [uncultured Desulfuromusa sp.]
MQQRLIINDKEFVLARAIELLNFKDEPEGYIFVVLDITDQIQGLNARISFIVILTGGLLLISFLIIYPSYGSLVQKIVTLNQSLEESNFTLEDRVQERTGELLESEKRFKEVLDHSPLGIVISDQTIMNIYYANPAICSMLGYTQSELEKMNIESIHRSVDFPQILQGFKNNCNQENGLALDVPFLKNGGSVFEADIHCSQVKFKGHDCLIGFIIDLTEKKKLEQHLRRTNKMEAIGLMAGGVAHDLNNVLTAIISYPELMLRKLPADHPMKKQLEEIQASGQRAAGIVSDLLTIARGVTVNKEPYDLHPLIQEYMTSAEYKNLSTSHPLINCEFKCEAGSSAIDCSPLHFSKILMNLIANAFEAIDGSGRVTVSTTNTQLDQFNNFDGSVPPGNYLLLKIEDSGSGIAAKDLEHIFEPFYSTKMMGQSGTGLGLSMVWNIVKDHNGHISVATGTQGTTFELVFPVTENQVVKNRQNSGDNFDYQGRNEQILIVDDEPQLLDLTSEMLSSLNYRVSTAASGEEALTVISEKDFDLVIVDMQMGAGINGRQTIEKIKAIKAETKIIIASGYAESQEVSQALKKGAISFVHKPYTLSQLGKAVTEALEVK